jgi:hypothetical protein
MCHMATKYTFGHKIYQMAIKYTKWPQKYQMAAKYTFGHKIYQMAIKYTKCP